MSKVAQKKAESQPQPSNTFEEIFPEPVSRSVQSLKEQPETNFRRTCVKLEETWDSMISMPEYRVYREDGTKIATRTSWTLCFTVDTDQTPGSGIAVEQRRQMARDDDSRDEHAITDFEHHFTSHEFESWVEGIENLIAAYRRLPK